MRDLVMAADGHTFHHKRENIKGHIKWQKQHDREMRSPKTNELLRHMDLAHNHLMRTTITDAINVLRRKIG